ncbi:phosphoribosyl-dephospho-CoA transferase MdcG domain-containing protein, partial [Salmonella enterica]|nr:phosphoribosyl-dephospho-CoA transferase [Salmonella enterica]
DPGYVAVGVRGRLREQRFAAVMPLAAVQRRVTPEALRGVISPRNLPALRALDQLRPVLAQEAWGVTGSAGFELATGIEALHAQSDLDLL